MKKVNTTLMVLGILAFMAILTTNSCNKDKTSPVVVNPNCPDTISFAAEVKPIIDMNCSTSGCHDVSAQGGFDFQGHANISLHADDILSGLRHETTIPMPIGAPKVADSLIQKFECWITQGKLNN